MLPPTSELLTRRRPLWEALSLLFLDTDLTDLDAAYIARVVREGGFTLTQARAVLRDEVALVLGGNLLTVAGEWAAFDLRPVEARFLAGRRGPGFTGRLALRLIRADWARVEAAHARGVE